MKKTLAPGERYRLEPLVARHDRRLFCSGSDELDRYLRNQASQDGRRRVASVFVAVEKTSGELHGFYTLSMATVLLDRLPEPLAHRLPLYPSIPAVRLGRLAVHKDAQGHGIGTFLLMDAMARSLGSEVAWVVFLVDAKDDPARMFYQSFGFQSFQDESRSLFLPRKTIEPLFR
ncbi:MAG: GNAT family N-acetyltransferase [Deltaproteobacteria bacterium]|nr:GNAT family N-acetyltransferase [Deltaproteobacteria bacterium]